MLMSHTRCASMVLRLPGTIEQGPERGQACSHKAEQPSARTDSLGLLASLDQMLYTQPSLPPSAQTTHCGTTAQLNLCELPCLLMGAHRTAAHWATVASWLMRLTASMFSSICTLPLAVLAAASARCCTCSSVKGSLAFRCSSSCSAHGHSIVFQCSPSWWQCWLPATASGLPYYHVHDMAGQEVCGCLAAVGL